MKKQIGIKIIKRQDIAEAFATSAPNIVNREAVTVGKKTGRELAGRVTEWVLADTKRGMSHDNPPPVSYNSPSCTGACGTGRFSPLS